MNHPLTRRRVEVSNPKDGILKLRAKTKASFVQSDRRRLFCAHKEDGMKRCSFLGITALLFIVLAVLLPSSGPTTETNGDQGVAAQQVSTVVAQAQHRVDTGDTT